MPAERMLLEPSSGGGQLLLSRNAPFSRRTVAYGSSGAHSRSVAIYVATLYRLPLQIGCRYAALVQ